MSIKQGGNTIAGAVGEYPLNEHNITNCITEIPQDIKLELNNGTLTLKAGSKVYVPNGAGVFDEITIASDLTLNGFGTGTRQIIVCYRNNILDADPNSFSGTSTPSGSGFFYNTSTNKIDYVSSGTALGRTYSFPLCVVTFVDSAISSIDQVFNGFGYIGSTVFALPGVKGLIPNGRNADGTLKNIATEATSVQTYTYTGIPIGIPSGEIYAGITSSGVIELNGDRTYNEVENVIYNGVNPELVCEFAKYRNPSGKIADFTLKTVYHALDWNDSSTISGWAMPSNKYISLTLGANGATYTAPADGYVAFSKYATGTNQTINITCNHFISFAWAHIASINIFVWMPVKKGDVFNVGYTAAGTYTGNYFRFIYAEGAQ